MPFPSAVQYFIKRFDRKFQFYLFQRRWIYIKHNSFQETHFRKEFRENLNQLFIKLSPICKMVLEGKLKFRAMRKIYSQIKKEGQNGTSKYHLNKNRGNTIGCILKLFPRKDFYFLKISPIWVSYLNLCIIWG
jgi:nucleoside diphosphate kinase